MIHLEKVKVLVAQWCPTLCDLMDCRPPGSSVHGTLQAWISEWVAIPFSRGSSWPRDWTQVSCIAGRFFTIWATTEAPWYALYRLNLKVISSTTSEVSNFRMKNILNLFPLLKRVGEICEEIFKIIKTSNSLVISIFFVKH